MPKYFLRFPEPRQKELFMKSLSLAAAAETFESRHESRLLIRELSPEEAAIHSAAGVEVFEDIPFKPTDAGPPGPGDQLVPVNATLAQVVQQVRAPSVWPMTRGQGVTIVILDTGIADAPEFGQRHSPLSFATDPAANPWDSNDGHGAMCASIAAGSVALGGRYDGIAPAAAILSARARTYDATEMYPAYERLMALRASGGLRGPVVLSNSFAVQVCLPPSQPADHPFFDIIRAAAAAGMAPIFAAGNWHSTGLCGWPPANCSPNTIWSANSLDEVLCVGAVDWNNTNQTLPHANSSRGPGQWASAFPKPDCVAPTYGEVLRYHAYQSQPWWGTSAASPVVVGLLALVYSRALQIGRVINVPTAFDLIRQTCDPLSAPSPCVGRGLVDCLAAVAAVTLPLSS